MFKNVLYFAVQRFKQLYEIRDTESIEAMLSDQV